MPHRPGLDGVRGLAVVAVIVHHLHPDVLPGGFLGVDLFFVLSGYLITTLLVTELAGSGRVRLSDFWARRARRLLPALYVLLVGVALASRLIPAWQRVGVRGDGIAALLYVANWHFVASGTAYFDTAGAPSPLLHLWSLAIEEQAYVVWPLVVALAWRLGRGRVRVVGWVAAVGALASASAMALTGQGDTAYFASHTRVQAILLGAVAAVAFPMAHRTGRLATARVAGAAGVAGLVTLVVMAVAVHGTDGWLYGGGFTLAALAGAAVAVGSTVAGPFATAFSFGPLRTLGRVSYGLYLVHWPVIVFCTAGRMHVSGLALDGVRLAIVAGLTTASYWLVEQPIRHGKLTTAAARWALPAAVAVTTVAVLAIGVGAGPVPDFLAQGSGPDPAGGAATTVAPLAPTTTVPTTTASTQPGATTAVPTTAPRPPLRRITLVGDSVAASLFPGLRDAAEAAGVQVVNRTAPGCGIVTNSVPAGADGKAIGFVSACHDAIGGIQAAAAKDGSDLIVVLSTWEAGHRLAGGVHLVPGTAAWTRSIDAGLAEVVRRVGAGGAPVVFLGAAPIVDGLVRTVDAETRRENLALVDVERAFTASAHLGWVDLAPIVCGADPAHCPSARDGVRLRPDDGAHFSPAGAAFVGPLIYRAVESARP